MVVWKQSGPGYLASTTWAVVLSHGWASPEVGGPSVSGVESGVEHTAFGTRGMPPLQGDVEATYGGSTAGPRLKSLQRSASTVGGWVLVKRPFKTGPSGRNQVRTHLPIHGPQRVGVSPGRRSRHDGRRRLPWGCRRRNWSHTCAHASRVSNLTKALRPIGRA